MNYPISATPLIILRRCLHAQLISTVMEIQEPGLVELKYSCQIRGNKKVNRTRCEEVLPSNFVDSPQAKRAMYYTEM